MTVDTIKERIYSVDFLRGVVMVIMLLDHTRDFVHQGALISDPTDPATTTVPLFFTRWITHFCAPTFVFLSGVSIYLQKMTGKTNKELARFLFTRGLWLIFLEFTVIRFLIVFNLDYTSNFGMAQVIWAIGVSMVVMAALIHLPLKVVGILGLAMILFHNLLDVYQLPPPIAFGGTPEFLQAVCLILHQQSVIPVGSSSVFIAYPLIPWIGVMAVGYAVGSIYSWDAGRRRKWLLVTGIVATALFVGLRFTNFYGDPNPWRTQTQFVENAKERIEAGERGPDAKVPTPAMSEPEFTIVSFFNTTKYPPSLLFLLMTLGPALIILGLTDRISGEAFWQKIGIVFGRVPLFFYVLQWLSAHLFGIGLSLAVGKDIGYFFATPGLPGFELPPDAGFSLPVVYLAWIAGLVLIYPLCYWYGNYKQRNKHWLLSYL